MKSRLLGGLTAREFLRRHWQKRPLFVRAALPQFEGVLDYRALSALAARDDVESRIVERRGGRWKTTHGPFGKVMPKKRNFTILVSGVNLQVAAADRLLRSFAFVPQARLDDVMVSFATAGGGVGPHIDSYDVFLLQGPGHRRWRVGNRVYLAAPGDLLYVPPGWRHHGVAVDRCFTYSIGFRAPRGAELGAAFLDFLHERGLPDATYRDPGLAPTRRPAAIPPEMIRFSTKVIKQIRWSGADVQRFLGEYLTQPKPHVVFRPTRAKGGWLRLDGKTQLLYCGGRFFINGDTFSLQRRDRRAMRELADRREVRATRLAWQAKLIGEWRRAGYVHLEKRDG